MTSHEAELLRCARHLVDDGLMAFATLDDALVTQWRHGRLANWIPLQAPICSATPAFWGLETDLLALQDDPGAPLALPKIGLSDLKGDADKISIEVFWRTVEETYLIVISRLGAPMDLEFELAKQIRARRIAEDNYRLVKEQIIEKQQLIDLVIDHAPAAIAMFDRDKRYVFATKRWRQYFGLELEPLIDRACNDVSPFAASPHLAPLDDCLNGNSVTTAAAPVIDAGGRTEWARFDHQPWRRADGGIGGAITFGEVLTKTVVAKQKLQTQNADLERANRDLQDFASILAHDLSAPLRAIQYTLDQTLAETQTGQNATNCAREALRHVRRMDTMLSDLLDYCRLDGRRAALVDVDVAALVREIVASLPGAEAFEVRVAGATVMMRAAVAPLDLALRNLLDNAIKHHDKAHGVIEITLAETPDCWSLTIADDGPGVDPAQHEAVFKLFQKTGASRDKPGSGVGLALVKKTLEAQNGAITLQSDPAVRRGATFRIQLPNVRGV